MNLIDTITDADGHKAARLYTASHGFEVYFGWLEGEHFRCKHYGSSRSYKTEAGARRAANRWIK